MEIQVEKRAEMELADDVKNHFESAKKCSCNCQSK